VLEQILRHFRRYQEILVVLIRNGFGFILIEQMGFGTGRALSGLDKVLLGQRIRQALGKLGPAFVKFGQFASTRPDIIPLEIIKELEKLQDRAPGIPYEEVRHQLEQELRAPIGQLFREFNPSPLASASIGQVHSAVLPTGEAVAVKVQRPNIAQAIQTDLEIMNYAIPLIEQRYPKVKGYYLQGILAEFGRWLEKELDYSLEGRNAERIAAGFKDDPNVLIPTIFWKYSTNHILTMSYVEGIRLNDRPKIQALQDGRRIAAQISRALLSQILRDGFFHGDPHPGNIFVLPGGKIAFVDFGIVGNLSPALKRHLAKLVVSLNRKDTRGMVKALLQIGKVPKQVNSSRLSQDLVAIRRKHLDNPIGQMSFRELVNECMNLVYLHRIELSNEFVILGKSLLTLEGIVHELDPEMSLSDIAKSFRGRLIIDRFPPIRWVKKGVFSWQKFWRTSESL
jgi:ubiquinone biosynthesis protein